MSEFNFSSQICTSRSQSERLLALGLKIETADCYHWQETDRYGDGNGKWHCEILSEYNKDHNEYLYNVYGVDGSDEGFFIPAWSLHRMMEMMPGNVTSDDWLGVSFDEVSYYHGKGEGMIGWEYYKVGNIYDSIIDCIEWLIKEGYFNKEDLNEHQVVVNEYGKLCSEVEKAMEE